MFIGKVSLRLLNYVAYTLIVLSLGLIALLNALICGTLIKDHAKDIGSR